MCVLCTLSDVSATAGSEFFTSEHYVNQKQKESILFMLHRHMLKDTEILLFHITGAYKILLVRF